MTVIFKLPGRLFGAVLPKSIRLDLTFSLAKKVTWEQQRQVGFFSKNSRLYKDNALFLNYTSCKKQYFFPELDQLQEAALPT